MRSKHHNINPILANLSHVVNHLSFGTPITRSNQNKISKVSKDFFDFESTHTMNGGFYKIEKLHQAFHHYIKVYFYASAN